jgi:hypothetical protein
VGIIASNGGGYDAFGSSAPVSGDTVVVGGIAETAGVFTGVGNGPRLGVERDGSGGYLPGITGAPDITYRMQRAPRLSGPWSDLVSNTARASGRIEYHETSPPPGAAFYRTAQP